MSGRDNGGPAFPLVIGSRVDAYRRKDDNSIVVRTDAYVSHRANRGAAWTSQYSLTPSEAEKLVKLLSAAIAEAIPEKMLAERAKAEGQS